MLLVLQALSYAVGPILWLAKRFRTPQPWEVRRRQELLSYLQKVASLANEAARQKWTLSRTRERADAAALASTRKTLKNLVHDEAEAVERLWPLTRRFDDALKCRWQADPTPALKALLQQVRLWVEELLR